MANRKNVRRQIKRLQSNTTQENIKQENINVAEALEHLQYSLKIINNSLYKKGSTSTSTLTSTSYDVPWVEQYRPMNLTDVVGNK